MQSKEPTKLQSKYKKKDPVKFNQGNMNDDKNCQSNVCSDKNCEDNKCVNMWPVKPDMHMQSMEPASFKKMCSGKNCQSTKSIKSVYDYHKCQSTVCSDKNCQETNFIHVQPLKLEKSSIMQLPKPAVPYKYKRLCSDKNCQSAKLM